MKRTLVLWLLFAGSQGASAQQADPSGEVRRVRLLGQLSEARALAEHELTVRDLEPVVAVSLHLELARIADRIGLHHNTRPVAEALGHVEAAARAAGPDAALNARIHLARAELHYRAEMAGREFPLALGQAQRAVEAFEALGDLHGQADAIHQLGLIRMQRGELSLARDLFDQAFALDVAGGERPFLRGEVERHLAFVSIFEGDPNGAIPHLELSLRMRREVGAVDASLFAANTLASTLIDLGRAEEAAPHVLYAMTVATALDSPTGTARLHVTLGRLHQSRGELDAARIAFATGRRLGSSVGLTGLVEEAQRHLDQLGGG